MVLPGGGIFLACKRLWRKAPKLTIAFACPERDFPRTPRGASPPCHFLSPPVQGRDLSRPYLLFPGFPPGQEQKNSLLLPQDAFSTMPLGFFFFSPGSHPAPAVPTLPGMLGDVDGQGTLRFVAKWHLQIPAALSQLHHPKSAPDSTFSSPIFAPQDDFAASPPRGPEAAFPSTFPGL